MQEMHHVHKLNIIPYIAPLLSNVEVSVSGVLLYSEEQRAHLGYISTVHNEHTPVFMYGGYINAGDRHAAYLVVALMYDDGEVYVTPRLGMYNTEDGGQYCIDSVVMSDVRPLCGHLPVTVL